MKASIVITDNVKQIMLTPESETDKLVLKMFTPNDEVTVEFERGTFGMENGDTIGYAVRECMGGYLRAYREPDSLMLVIKPKRTVEEQKQTQREIREALVGKSENDF